MHVIIKAACTFFVRSGPVDCCARLSSALPTYPRPADSAAGDVAGARHNELNTPLILNRLHIDMEGCILPWAVSQYTVSRIRSEAHELERILSRAQVTTSAPET